ncbi:Glu/Leu/Phe/Val dehydrogenase dimerization domain-containing protein [Marinobacter gelidimuriae]|uniref:Glu/Leu/Phe/Val dehydrogenase dimerization domain-containing protein n=1 Tax=Marinobacter gelidimuriae TaxID=2739064 RepID=UPI00036A5DA7|nr:Glu/Leu/Phe/Val dehydrogenase dimerization domain-containing protein [Marinobacter gelidimuriae]
MRSSRDEPLMRPAIAARPKVMPVRPALLLTYTDALEGFRGYLAIDSLDSPLVAGGFRVQPGLTADRIASLARTMTLKQQIAGLNVGGAKSGIDYDPAATGKRAAVMRFMTAIRPYLASLYSMGPDLNTRYSELDEAARTVGLTSIKGAIAPAQGLTTVDLEHRLAVLDELVAGNTLGQQRAGHGVAAAVTATLDILGSQAKDASIAVHGFGALGGAAACRLAQQGARITGLADQGGAVLQPSGFSADALFASMKGARLPAGPIMHMGRPDRLFDEVADVLVLAAKEDSLTPMQAERVRCRAVICGANLALSVPVETILHRRGIVVVPDFIAGCGGSLAMDSLFGPTTVPSASSVLRHIDQRMRAIVEVTLKRARQTGAMPRDIALAQCAAFKADLLEAPYGHHISLTDTHHA